MNLRTSPRRTALVSGAVVLGFLVTGCGGGGGSNSGSDPCQSVGAPAAALATAKKALDKAPSIAFTMSTGSVPKSGNAVLGANGTLTHQPAFQGTVDVFIFGGRKSVPVVAVDGKVYAQILTPSMQPINPSDYSAPDPAAFADPATGISGLLLKLTDLSGCQGKLAGKDRVAEFSGTLAGALVAPIIPSASASGSYRTTVGLRSDGSVATLAVTGNFFDADGDVTYDLSFTQGQSVTVTAP